MMVMVILGGLCYIVVNRARSKFKKGKAGTYNDSSLI